MKKRPLLWGSVCVLGVAGVGGAVVAWRRAEQRQAFITAAVPGAPELTKVAGALRDRVAACTARAIDQHDVAALGELSRLYHANGFLAEATLCYDGLEQLQPGEPRWAHRHAAILAGYGETEAALPRWQKVVQLAPDYVPARLRLGDVLLKLGRIDEAAEVYAAALARKPDEPYALLGLARCDFERQRWEPARERLERVVARTNFGLGYDLIVTVYERLGQRERAAKVRGMMRASGAYRDPDDPWIEELLDDCYDSYRLSVAAGVASVGGNYPGALRRLEQALVLAPDDVAIHFQLGTTYLAVHDFERARTHFEGCTTIAPEFADGWAQLASLWLSRGRTAEADRVIAAGLAHCPGSPGLHLMSGRRLRAAGRREQAIEEFRASIRLRPNEAEAYVDLATVFFELERVEEGLTELRRALVVEPEHPTVLSTLAYHAITSGDETAAREWLKRAEQQPRVAPEYLARLKAIFRTQFGRDL